MKWEIEFTSNNKWIIRVPTAGQALQGETLAYTNFQDLLSAFISTCPPIREIIDMAEGQEIRIPVVGRHFKGRN